MERVVLKNKQMPLHYQIADYLINMLKSSETPVGERLPPEEKLSNVFGVSRATVRHALDHLSKQGMIIKKQGKGNFWTDISRGIRKEKQSGINRQIFRISEKTTVKSAGKELVKASAAVSQFLGLDKGAEVYKFTRLRYLGNEPLSFTINYMPKIFGEKILKKHLRQMMMLEILENVIGLELGIIEHEVEINRADKLISSHLSIAPLDPVLTVKTSVYDGKQCPVEIVWTYFVENKYKFKVVLDK
ncbi:MAG: putative HTH-type transcriptional regulator YegW [Smithella sp. PtaU1.Bin162]|nr:MAG: putative HTH-type transcriptional regulator YegW [Smithella sp. PtaU1.Bin162]